MTVYYADIREYGDLPGLLLLPETRRNRVSRYLKLEDRARCLVAGLLLRRFVGSEDVFHYSDHGKPYLDGRLWFNLSHSGNYVTLAVASFEVGVDVEEIRPWSEKVAAKCFLPSEISWLRAQKDSHKAFYKLWTAKEAIMKGSGAGFSMPPETFSIAPDESRNFDADRRGWWLSWTDLPGHTVCAAAAQPDELSMTLARRRDLL